LVLAPTRELAQQVSLLSFSWGTHLEMICRNQKYVP
jgi:superfamily II DNA/RNA helicase